MKWMISLNRKYFVWKRECLDFK